jgi:2-oxoglutarate dehydrogenase E2 component (dihydrolipoamide succinyltransferase)
LNVSNVFEVRAPSEQSEGTRAQVLRWLHAVGDEVKAQEPLLELETDKVTIEVPAPANGRVRQIIKHEREEVSPGELLGQLEALDANETRDSAMQVTGPAGPDAQTEPSIEQGREKLSPAVRRLLRENSLEPAGIQGTGREGRITAQDVIRHVSEMGQQTPSTAPQGQVEADSPTTTRRVPHTTMRRRVAEHMVRSLQTAPHVTSVFEVDLSAVIAHRKAHREDYTRQGVELSLTAYFVAAAVAAIKAVPSANARWTDDALEINEPVHIGIATALGDEGLVVPVLRDAHNLNLLGVARGLSALVRRGRDRALSPADMQGGTFTISNHGVSGSLIATPIVINQPQSAILGIGKVEKRVIVREIEGADHILVRPMCYATLTIDHRVMDGFSANRFLQVFSRALENWPVD